LWLGGLGAGVDLPVATGAGALIVGDIAGECISLGEGAFPIGDIDGEFIGAAACDDNEMLRITIGTIKRKLDLIIVKMFRMIELRLKCVKMVRGW